MIEPDPPPAGPIDDSPGEKLRLEVAYLRRQNEKLQIEVDDLKSDGPRIRRVKSLLPVATVAIAAFGFGFGIYQYMHAEAESRNQRRIADEGFRRELTRDLAKPLWDKQFSLYVEAAEKAAIIANSKDENARSAAEERFWVLYWGPLAVVEDVVYFDEGRSPSKEAREAKVEAAMLGFGKALESPPGGRDGASMKQLSLTLAHEIREAIADAFNVDAVALKGGR